MVRMMYGYGFGPSILGVLFGGLFGLAILVLLILLIIWAVRGLRRPGPMGMGHHMGMGYHEDAAEIAKARYAKGEISQAEYKKIINDLKG